MEERLEKYGFKETVIPQSLIKEAAEIPEEASIVDFFKVSGGELKVVWHKE